MLPRAEIVIHGAPCREVSGKQAPLTAGPQQIEDRVEYGTEVRGSPPAANTCWRQQRRDQRPRKIAEIRRIKIRHDPVSRKSLILYDGIAGQLFKHALSCDNCVLTKITAAESQISV